MKKSSLALLIVPLIMSGAGCSTLRSRLAQEKLEVNQEREQQEVQALSVREAEYFLRSRDDIKPGQPDVTNQTLFAKTADGQIREMVRDVHAALGGLLDASNYLVQQPELSRKNQYLFFVDQQQHLFAFDKDAKKFVDLPVTTLTRQQTVGGFFYAPDHSKVAIVVHSAKNGDTISLCEMVSGTVTHVFETGAGRTVVDPNQPGLALSAATAWKDSSVFYAVVYEKNAKKIGGKISPVDGVVIDADKQKYSVEVVRWTHPKFGFSFEVSKYLQATVLQNGSDVSFTEKGSGIERMVIVVMPDIPGVALPKNKIEQVNVGGVVCPLYHDTDQAEGAPLDRMVCTFPGGDNSVSVGSHESPSAPVYDLKPIAKSWKWNK